MSHAAADQANQQLVDLMIAEGALWSPELIAAFRATPRHHFLDRVWQFQPRQERWRETITREPGPAELKLIYADRALITHLGSSKPGGKETPISSSSQPTLMAQMLEDLQLRAGMRVLEIGAGTGYNAALIAHAVGPDRVISLDVDRNVLSEAWDHLRAFPERRVVFKHGDGRLGCPEEAPFDRIMATAATPVVEPAWLAQLTEGGMLSAPLSLAPGLAFVICGRVSAGIFRGRLKRAAYFMPLRAEHEAGDDEDPPASTERGLEKVPAPWANIFERRKSRGNWLRFVQSLALYSLLRGLTVEYRVQSEDLPQYGVSNGEGPRCWFGTEEWQVKGSEGQALGEQLWRAFLDAGAPWPTEYEIRIGPQRGLPLCNTNSFIRHDAAGEQVWELIEPRVRSNWL